MKKEQNEGKMRYVCIFSFNKKMLLLLLYLSDSTRVVIGQFSGPHFTVWPAKIESCSFPVRPINLRDIINILPTSFFRAVLQVTDPRFPPLIYNPRASHLGHKSKGKNLQYGPQNRLVRGMSLNFNKVIWSRLKGPKK